MEITSPLQSQGPILPFSYAPSIPRDFPELATQTLLLRGLSPDVPAHAVIAPFMAQARQNLAWLLQTLSWHLLHYSSLGGSIELSARSALEQAREAALESVG